MKNGVSADNFIFHDNFSHKMFYYYKKYHEKLGNVKEVENLNYKEFERETSIINITPENVKTFLHIIYFLMHWYFCPFINQT